MSAYDNLSPAGDKPARIGDPLLHEFVGAFARYMSECGVPGSSTASTEAAIQFARRSIDSAGRTVSQHDGVLLALVGLVVAMYRAGVTLQTIMDDVTSLIVLVNTRTGVPIPAELIEPDPQTN